MVGTQLFNAQTQAGVATQFEQAFTQGDSDLVGVKGHFRLEQRLARLIQFADNNRGAGAAVELLLELEFEQAALLLHHQDFVQALGKT